MKGLPLAHIEKILTNLPKSPGVYQMRDISGKVMYVGKAKILRNRVNSYFKEASELSPAKRQMVAKIADIEIITCMTEVEALVLETNLIKHLSPKYNILMKDDKNLSYLKITNSPVPELIKTRQRIRDGAEYFGPYVAGAEQSVRALRKIFQIRNCRMKFASKRGKIESAHEGDEITITDKAGKTAPCMDYYIGLCPAPCLLEGSKLAEHARHIDAARSFLRGDTSEIFARMETDMRHRSSHQDFEEAQKIKESLEALRGLGEKQKVRDIVEGDIDIFIQYEKYDNVYVALTQVRSSQIVGVFRYEVENSEDESVAIQFLTRQYIESATGDVGLPSLLLLASACVDESFLLFLSSQSIRVEYPKIGPKNDLLEFTLRQLREYAYKKQLATLENTTLTREHMVHVLEKFGLEIPEKGEIVFECYDISHTNGQFTVASRAVIVNGKPDPSRYRKYNIKSLPYIGKIDDFASHREVMLRRTLEGMEQKNFPHLIIIDGGKGQLSSALSGIREGYWKYESSLENHTIQELTGKGDIAMSSVKPGLFMNPENNESFLAGFLPAQEGQMPSICSIAKREEEIFLPGQKNPVLFEKGTGELMLLQKARDESHRFAITANRSARMKSMKKNILEEIPGIGPVTRKKLLKLAGSVEALKSIASEELMSVCTHSQIASLRDHGIIE